MWGYGQGGRQGEGQVVLHRKEVAELKGQLEKLCLDTELLRARYGGVDKGVGVWWHSERR